MPLFANKFEPKPAPLRSMRCNDCPAIKEDLNDFNKITITLGNYELRFCDGNWILPSTKINVDDVVQLKNKMKTLEETNNLSKVKIEVLLDLLTEHISENNLREVGEK